MRRSIFWTTSLRVTWRTDKQLSLSMPSRSKIPELRSDLHLIFFSNCPVFSFVVATAPWMYSVDHNTNHLNTNLSEVQISNGLVFKWSVYAVLCTQTDHLNNEPVHKENKMASICPMQWGSENRTCPVFEWLKVGRVWNGEKPFENRTFSSGFRMPFENRTF